MLVLLASCSTISMKAAGNEALKLLDRVQNSDVEGAMEMTARPFLFESEILVSDALVNGLWDDLAGIDFSDAQINRFAVIDPESARYFTNSWEVRTWLENYTDESAAVVFVDWQNRQLVIIVDRNIKSKKRIQAFGEVR